MSLFKLIGVLGVAVCFSLPVDAVLLFSEDFESPDVNGTTDSTGNTSGKVPDNGNWIGANAGFGSTRRGMIDKSSGHFNAPAGNDQAFAFRYTNSGVTTAVGAITTIALLPGADRYFFQTNVVRDDGRNAGRPYSIELVALVLSGDVAADNLLRREHRAARPGTKLLTSSGSTTTSGNAPAGGNFGRVRFTYIPTAGVVGQDLAIRFLGATTTATIDNVSLSIIPEPGTLSLLGLVGLAAVVLRRYRA